ncbi:hypothetical protein Tco_1016742 [Tanacetum coccineum]|uniref:Uncharacterized protein n=1 Tax=Tanacetum coccineum TaxID=301880 RepID=A0ABQ5FRG7_9ASTR
MKIYRMPLKRKPDSECLEHVHLHNDCKKEKTCYLPLESKTLLIPTERTSVNNSPTQTFRDSLPLYDKGMVNPQYGVAKSDEHSLRNSGVTGMHMATNTINKRNITVGVKNVSTN